MTRPGILFYLLILLAISTAGHAAEQCVKQVFKEYCLGGSLSQQLERTPSEKLPQVNGDREGVIFEKDNEKIYVLAYKGIIYKVLRTFEPETPATMKDLRRRLQRKYGDYKDLSEYPDDTKNTARQQSFIRRGEGVLKNVWQLPGQHWRIELGWDRKLGITVAYLLNELDEQQREAALQGL